MLQVKNLSKIYKSKGGDEVKALDGVTLTFPDKGMVFLLGKSGSGKSTLLNVCGGLDKADGGELIVGGRSSADFTESDFDSYRNTYIGFVFQEYNLLDEFTVYDNVALALEMQGETADPEKIDGVLKRVEMSEFSHRKPNTLSGGQKQRVAIARALVKNPKIIMADEPTGALDSETGEQVLQTLKKLSADKLVLIVSHDREFAENYADRIIELKDGRVISDIEKNKAEEEVTENSDKFIRAKLPLKKAIKIGAHSIKGRPFRLIFSALLSVIAFTIFGLMANLAMFSRYDAGAKAFTASGETYLSIDKRYSYVTNRYENGQLVSQMRGDIGKGSFNIAEVKELEEEYKTEAVLRKSCSHSIYNVRSNGSYNNRAFYLNRIENFAYAKEGGFVRQNIYGRYPEKNNEVAITSYTFDAIKDGYEMFDYGVGHEVQGLKSYDDIIGSHISLKSGIPEFIVTGVIDTPIPEKYKPLIGKNDYYSDLNDHWCVVRDSGIYLNLFVSKSYFDNLYDDMYMYFEDVSAYLVSDDEGYYSFDYLGTEGRGKQKPDMYSFDGAKVTAPLAGKNAALTVGSFALKIDKLFGENSETPKDIKEKLYSLKYGWHDLGYNNAAAGNQVFNYEYLTNEEKLSYFTDVCSYFGKEKIESALNFEIKKSGVSDSISVTAVCITHSQEGGLYLSGELFDKFNFNPYNDEETVTDYVEPEGAFIDSLLLYGGNAVKGAMRDGNTNDRHFRIKIENQSILEVNEISDVFDTVKELFVYGGIVTALFSCLLLFNFISSSITAKKREIGILRALGARKSDVFKIFISEALIVGAICLILSLAATLGVCLGVSAFLTKITSVSILSFHFVSFLALLGLDILVCFVSTLLPVMLHSRKPPVESIRSL